MENGDSVTISKLGELKEVLVKVKDVQEMYYGIEAWDPDVPRPEVNTRVNERRPIEPPVIPGKNPRLLLSWLTKSNIHQISDQRGLEFWADHQHDFALDLEYDSDTYDIEEVA